MTKFIIQLILEIALLISILVEYFVLGKTNISSLFVIILIYMILMLIIHKYKNVQKYRDKIINYIVVGGSFITTGCLFALGLMNDFSTSYNVIYKNYISNSRWILTILLVIISEIIRHIITKTDEKGLKKILIRIPMLLCYIMIDYFIAGKYYDFNSFHQCFQFLLVIATPSIAKNLYLDFLCEKYDYRLCLCYRFIVELYSYFLPIEPNVNLALKTILLTIAPYFQYILIKENIGRKKTKSEHRNRENNNILNKIMVVFLIIIVCLISCQFKYAMIGIGSGSMTGTINKGDAIIYENYKKDLLEKGEIIVFNKNNKIIVHRIMEIHSVGTKEQVYVTKGDANPKNDNWIVSQEDVIGVVKLRVKWVAWPSVLLNSLF